MKRIMNGQTYNTETATAVKRVEHPIQDDMWVGNVPAETLYRTRHGAWFLYCESVDIGFLEFVNEIRPLTPEEAFNWLAPGNTEIIERYFGEQPEAGMDEASLSLRVPRILKSRIEAAAAKEKQSINAWVMRAAERALGSTRV